MVSPVKVVFSVAAVGVIVYGVVDILTNFETNDCIMTYMYEMPEYLKVQLKDEVRQKYPRYNLYIYGEGQYAQDLRQNGVRGIPVLFIPGNAGSYKQVRSLGSVSLRKSMDIKNKIIFNYFVAELNEEFSGLYGAVLQDQTEFIHECVKKILGLYIDVPNPPKSVVLAGHSMGGMLARALFTLPGFDADTVNTIITQSTPHQGPVIAIDQPLSQFYKRVNSYWQRYKNASLNHVTFVSTGGGHRDIQVRNDLTSLDTIVDPDRSVSTCTMSVPKAWVSTDHQCAVWCKQVVLATVRALFEIVDSRSVQVKKDPVKKMAIFRHHFLSHSGVKSFKKPPKGEITLDANNQWVVQNQSTWRFSRQKVSKGRYFAVPIPDTLDEVDTFVAVSDVPLDNWICACKTPEPESPCVSCTDLSNRGHIIPPNDAGRKTLQLDLKDLQGMSHIVLILPRTAQEVEVMGDLYSQIKRHLSYQIPGFSDIIMAFPESVTKSAAVLNLPNNTVYHSLKLWGFNSVLLAFTATLETRRCKTTQTGNLEGSVMTMHVPWSYEDTYSFSGVGKSATLSVKLQSGKTDQYANDVELQLYVHPTCEYVVRLVASPWELMGQFVRFYGLLLPAFLVTVLLMALNHQLVKFAETGACPGVLESIQANAKPWKVVPLTMVIRLLLNWKMSKTYIDQLSLPADDSLSLNQKGIWFRFLPLLMFIIALGIISFHTYLVSLAITVISRTLGFLFRWCPDIVLKLGTVLQFIGCLGAIGASVTMCGTLGILICHILCFLKVLRMCYLSHRTQDERIRSKFNFFFVVLLLWMWVLILNAPPLIVWAKNLQYSYHLAGDPSRITGIIGCVTLSLLLLLDNPVGGRGSYLFIRWMVYIEILLMLLYGVESIYRIPYVIITALVGVAVPQVFSSVISMVIGKDKSE